MRDYFYDLADRLVQRLEGSEVLMLAFQGEESDFVRFNRNRIRQAGTVAQRSLTLDLIEGTRHAAGDSDLSGDLAQDLARLAELMDTLREQRAHLPEDPYLYYSMKVRSTERVRENLLPESGEVVEQVTTAAEGLDLVGIWASGTLCRGFANSLGQRNWHASATFTLDWSCCHAADKAVKMGYAGFEWERTELTRKMAEARDQLAVMAQAPRTIEPGPYRVYLAPRALQEILDMMSWGGFDLKSHRTAQTPLIQMVREGRRLHPGVAIVEDNTRGLAPTFTGGGFLKPVRVVLIENGAYRDCLANPRSAKEYGVPVNSGSEFPCALDMAAGALARADTLQALDTGLYINNLWYCNFSDRNHCRITGMTRFACFWVEGGRIRAPVNVMRFDESVYHLLGDRLLDLTAERELIFDPSTYGQRSTASAQLPGALIEGCTFTL
jgi:predicted Zn-dependent protease